METGETETQVLATLVSLEEAVLRRIDAASFGDVIALEDDELTSWKENDTLTRRQYSKLRAVRDYLRHTGAPIPVGTTILQVFSELQRIESSIQIDRDKIQKVEAGDIVQSIVSAGFSLDNTPMQSPALLGLEQLRKLKDVGSVTRFTGDHTTAMEPAVMTEDEQRNCVATCENEAQVIAYLTPILTRSLQGENVLVNSEEYRWLKASHSPGTVKYNQKPDMFVCHPAMYEARGASRSDDKTISLRKDDFRFGVLPNWSIRDSLAGVLEGKFHIGKALNGLGEVVNYGRLLAQHTAYPRNQFCIILFDKDEFWVNHFVGGVITKITKCAWVTPGSLAFFQSSFNFSNDWARILQFAEQKTYCTAEGNAFLGSGSFGRVFKVRPKIHQPVSSSRNPESAIKIVTEDHTPLLQREYSALKHAHEMLPGDVMGPTDLQSCPHGGAFMVLESVGKHISRPVSQAMATTLLRSLRRVHEAHIIHGDPRVANAVLVNDSVRWIDFMAYALHEDSSADFAQSFQRDMGILSASILGIRDMTLVDKMVEIYSPSDEATVQGIVDFVAGQLANR